MFSFHVFWVVYRAGLLVTQILYYDGLITQQNIQSDAIGFFRDQRVRH